MFQFKHPPMTAAERQRRCRANGKGRHRGGVRKTKAYREQLRLQNLTLTLRARIEFDELVEAAAAAGALPPVLPPLLMADPVTDAHNVALLAAAAASLASQPVVPQPVVAQPVVVRSIIAEPASVEAWSLSAMAA